MTAGKLVRRTLAVAADVALLAMAAALLHAGRSALTGGAAIVHAGSRVPADQYGGVARGAAPATGYFQVKQVGGRWMFVTPDGNGMWLTGVFGVTYADTIDDFGTSALDRVVTKYGEADWRNNWRINTARRLKGWGFNVLSAYHHWAMRAGPLSDPNPEKMPYIHIINPARYALRNGFGLGTGPVKDLIVATDPRYYDGYRGAQSLDFFDPNFESYIDGWMRGDDGLMYGNIGNPWMLGIAMDEGDSLLGFGPGAEIPAPRLHPHLGWIALVTNFEQTNNPWMPPPSSYADRKVYTKYALRDFLAGKYGTIQALDAAWGSNYTTFDSAGGWGLGTGLLDENGRNHWIGYWGDEMATANPRAHADLDEFLYFYAKRYFTVMAAKMRRYAPTHLVLGPTSLNGWAGLTRKEILRAAGESVDVLQAAIGSQQILDLTVKYAGNKPIVTWDSFVANPDSGLWRYPSPEDNAPPRTRLAVTQEGRGQLYGEKVDFLFDAATSAGVHPVAGITFWGWSDHWGEKANFGLVTLSDNAYDGKQAVVDPGKDAAGWPTGGEENNYGDFLTGVSEANASVMQQLAGPGASVAPVLTLFNPSQGWVSMITSTEDFPSLDAYANYAAGAPVQGHWVMGDWDGDGVESPAVYGDNGAFYYTNDVGPTPNWRGIWFGFSHRPPVAGRFDASVGHDCLGVVDSAPWPGYGTAFAVYFTCNLDGGADPPKISQWIGPVLPEAGGFTGSAQFVAGDFDGDGVDSIAVRRGPHVAWTNVPPTTRASEFSFAQYLGAPAGGEGQIVTGDWDGTGRARFGLFYADGLVYRRNDLDWNSGAYTRQYVGQPIGTPVTACARRPAGRF
jgi:hypothetical protein